MERACAASTDYSCIGDRVLDVLFNCFVDGNGDSAIEVRDFECEKECVDGGEGQYDYCSDSPAPIIHSS
jgi:hypothetical protein